MGRPAVTTTVVEVGPCSVRGPGSAPQQWISTALEFIDDSIALLDDHPVDVSGLWRDVLDGVAGERADRLVLVVPTWWSGHRVGVVSAAAHSTASDVVVVQRSSILGDDPDATVLELSADYAVVTPPASHTVVLARGDPAVVTYLEAASSVLLDVPAEVPPPAPATIARLRSLGISVHLGAHRIRRAGAALPPVDSHEVTTPRIRLSRRAATVLASTTLTVAAAGGGWAAEALTADPARPADGAATRLLVEGGIAVRVPATWNVERITSGSGSARVRVSATGGSPALHITQSAVPATSLADIAESLRRAMDSEPDGVFVDFDPSAERGGRPAVTYVERRSDSLTRWAVLADGAIRIAIGCQSAPADPVGFEDVCVDAVRSARVVR